MGSDWQALEEAEFAWPALGPRQTVEAYYEFAEQSGIELPSQEQRDRWMAHLPQDWSWREMVDAREAPYHKLDLPEYVIGKYPVTNAEFARFVEAGGYQEKGWWTEAGWQEKEARNWAAARYWQDPRYNKPNQPVVGVSWYEAVAYCRWLSADRGETYRLPTEAEWEKAARGVDGNLFVWGNKFEASRLNVLEGEQQVMATTPVGIYPDGRSPFGVFDCAGNVWEWCTTKAFKPYPYDREEDEWSSEYLKGTDDRILRGGCWNNYQGYTRCAYRAWFLIDNRDSRYGFRVVSASG